LNSQFNLKNCLDYKIISGDQKPYQNGAKSEKPNE